MRNLVKYLFVLFMLAEVFLLAYEVMRSAVTGERITPEPIENWIFILICLSLIFGILSVILNPKEFVDTWKRAFK